MSRDVLQLDHLIEGFKLSCATEGKAIKTIDWYTCYLLKFQQFLEPNGMPTDVTQIDRGHIRAFIRYLQTEARCPRSDKPLSQATVQGYVRTLKAFFSWLMREEYLANNPMAGIPVPKASTKIINTFTDDQIAQLAQGWHSSNGNNSRNLAILLLMLDSGLRVSEVTGISLDDVDLEAGQIRITRAKGGNERIVPIGSVVRRALWKYINHHRSRPLTDNVTGLFLNERGLPLTRNGVQQMLRRQASREGITGVRVSPHSCRHTFAKNYLLNGGDIFSLQRILGHSSLASVRIYLNLFATDIKKQHQRYSPIDVLAGTTRLSSALR